MENKHIRSLVSKNHILGFTVEFIFSDSQEFTSRGQVKYISSYNSQLPIQAYLNTLRKVLEVGYFTFPIISLTKAHGKKVESNKKQLLNHTEIQRRSNVIILLTLKLNGLEQNQNSLNLRYKWYFVVNKPIIQMYVRIRATLDNIQYLTHISVLVLYG